MAKVSEVNEILELSEYNPIKENDEADELSFGVYYHHNTLKKTVMTRWNSILHMISSILKNIAMTMFSKSETERLNMMALTAGIADPDITTVIFPH